MSVGYQSFYQAQLTSNITDTDTVIPLDTAPTPDEGFLVIESTVTAKREIIYYTSKTSNSVTVPSGAGNGRGYDGTTAVSHLQGAAVIMAPVGAMFEELREQFTTTPQGWTSMVQNISTVTANGNRSYDLGFDATVASTLSPGMRLRTTRTSAAPQTAFSLDGSNDYYNDTTVAGMTFTDDFSVSAWVYLTSYQIGYIASRYNGTSGWGITVNADGTIQMRGWKSGSANYSEVKSYQSVPLNKWVHIAGQLDMSTFTATTTTSYIMIDGVNVPAVVARAGTNPTDLTQAGNLEIGSINGGANPFPGYLDQVAIYSAKVTQATHLAAMHQALTGSETSLISAYSNGSTTDLNTTNANNLTAQNGATTASVSPFGNNATSSTLDYELVMNVSGSTATVQVPSGCTIPTTGGVSAVAYSTQASPYGWVSDKGRWELMSLLKTDSNTTSNATYGSFISNGFALGVPIGGWEVGLQGGRFGNTSTTTAVFALSRVSMTGLAGTQGVTTMTVVTKSSAAAEYTTAGNTTSYQTHTVFENYIVYTFGATTSAQIAGGSAPAKITATPSGL